MPNIAGSGHHLTLKHRQIFNNEGKEEKKYQFEKLRDQTVKDSKAAASDFESATPRCRSDCHNHQCIS